MALKPAVSEILKYSPQLDSSQVKEFLGRLSDRYFEDTDVSQIALDAERLFSLKGAKDHRIEIFEQPDNRIGCTVYASDVPGLFSLLTGLLSASGFDIEQGSIYTYSRESEEAVAIFSRGSKRTQVVHTRPKPRYIIDRFTGTIREDVSFNAWKDDFTAQVARLFVLLPDAKTGSIIEARQMVYEAVSSALIRRSLKAAEVLLPVEMQVARGTNASTNLTIICEDTPFFLFAVSNALALYGFSIESVSIQTAGNRIEDLIEITDIDGKAVTDPAGLNKVKMSVLLTKQFTYFLGSAPDPYAALVRFEQIAKELTTAEPLLSNPEILKDLSRLLSVSDFLWEDFIRIQYENILPLLDPASRNKRLSLEESELTEELRRKLLSANDHEEKRKALNDFKDREIYLIDLEHIIRPDADFLFLSRKLSRLAEVVVSSAVGIASEMLAMRYGKPLTFAGQEARYAIMGLGKLGGAALGYASDVELLFIYADNGATDGREKIGNAEYFERLFKTAVNLIDTKREGIFHIDLRLRPHGNAGPVACSLESYCQYYGPGGQAHSYEKLALIRMRAIGGDPELGARIERIRDEIVYRSDSIELHDLRELREKQLKQHAGGKAENRPNAKFSPGGLVDLEYSVQIIQCRYGSENDRLRTPRIHVALEELVRAGIMSGNEAEQLVSAYHFLRKLINGLRMLRGSAKDLFLPAAGSDEYTHLARRTGYAGKSGLDPAQELRVDFETKTAAVRSFVEAYIGRDSIPGPPGGNVADLVFSENMPKELASRILGGAGLKNCERALKNIDFLKGTGAERTLFAGLAVLAWDLLRETPDPDMALNNWERFARSLPSKEDHYRQLLDQPLQLEVLLQIFAGSQFLADTVIREPQLVSWVAQPELIRTLRKTEDIRKELTALSDGATDNAAWMKSLRALRRREILRIGTRDICLGAPFTDVVTEISRLADAILQASLARSWRQIVASGNSAAIDGSGFAVFAFGKLGGEELNYSSDIDLLALFDAERYPESAGTGDTTFSRLMELLRSHLADHTESGFVYRVDFRLRPYGRSSLLAHSLKSVLDYYRTVASDWELQALIKLRPVAGDLDFGRKACALLHEYLLREVDPSRIARGIRTQRNLAASRRSNIARGVDIKSGEGGIRDIEFLVQGLQMIHAHKTPEILTGNTLNGLEKLVSRKILTPERGNEIRGDYLYLRRIEHFLQLLEDRQVHVVPANQEALDALARRIEGKDEEPAAFAEKIEKTMTRVRGAFDEFLP
ncbi:MAG: glutamate-ammonia-ligase adenylyltransferase [Spirochaetales bacterium]|nr:glutamate-ammonia-ligase adenylyltransferase [Spirochaetales bacterium]